MSNGYGQKIAHYQRPVDLLEIAQRGSVRRGDKAEGAESFKDMFSKEVAGSSDVTFSKHARERLFSRGIELSDDDVQKISAALDKADIKGAKETLIMMDEIALVAAVKNRTIITAFDRSNLQEGIVTSIDSAVII